MFPQFPLPPVFSLTIPKQYKKQNKKQKKKKKKSNTNTKIIAQPQGLYARYSLPMKSNPRACVKTEASFVNSLILPSILSEIGNTGTAKNLNVTKVPTLVYLRQYHHRDILGCFPSCSS